MSPSFLTLFISAILVAGPVSAGSRAWESSIVYAQQSHFELHGDLFEPKKGNSTIGASSTISASELKKRYVTINPGTGNADDRLWPKGKIQYCFESSATKELFFEDLHEARKLWENAGLGNGFEWVEKDSSFCKDNANRPNFLLIVKSDGLSCTTGIPPLKKMSGDPESRGPLMRLTTDLGMGKENLVANFAHQMGHAWGLFHEHQNPAWWSSDYAAADGDIFSSSNFKCEKLADYASVSQRLTAEQMKKACTSRAYAKTYRFSAAEYLPITDSTAYRASSTATEPDWDSIMIYDSKMGSALTKPNGDAITPVLSPSQRDVDGLKTLYGVSSSVKFNPLGSKSHPKLETFKDIRKKDKDSGCKEAEDDDEDNTPATTTSSSSIPSATATADCAAIGLDMLSDIPDEINESFERRHMHHDLHSRRLEKRGLKKGDACVEAGSKWTLKSFNYPETGKNTGADLYGWSIPGSCDNYKWGGALDITSTTYHTEHILEWSVITNFFTDMNKKFEAEGKTFTDPDSEAKQQNVNFCRYWKQSWDFAGQQSIPNPASQAAGMTGDTANRYPVKWIAAAYPYKDQKNAGGEMFLDELPLLQALINSPAKNNMFSGDPGIPIYKDDDMADYVKGVSKNKRDGKEIEPSQQRREALQRVRSVVGVFKYMQEPRIKDIFKKEKIRMGAVIDGIDRTLPQYPRTVGRGTAARTFTPWQTQGLGTRWDTYMDEVFETAKKKGTKFVKDNLERLNNEFTSKEAKERATATPDPDLDEEEKKEEEKKTAEWAKLREDMAGDIEKLEAAWKAVPDWTKPW